MAISRYDCFVLFSAVLFGCGALFVKLGGPHPLIAGEFRCVLAALVLAPLCNLKEARLRFGPRHYLGMLATVSCNFCFVTGFCYAKASVAISIAYTSPLIAPALCWLWMGSAPSRREAALLAVGTAGIFFVGWGSGSASGTSALGVAGAVGAAISYAAFMVTLRGTKHGLEVVCVGNAVAGLALFGLLIPFLANRGTLDNAGWFTLNGLGCAVAFVLVTTALPRLSLVRASLLTCVEVPAAVVAVALFLGEVPSAVEVLGMLLILGAVSCDVLSRDRREQA